MIGTVNGVGYIFSLFCSGNLRVYIHIVHCREGMF